MALSVACVERRIMSLDDQINDYFVKGMEQAVAREEKAGHVIPPFDDTIYTAKVPNMILDAEKPRDEAASTSEGSSTDKKTTNGKSEIEEAETPSAAEGNYVKKKESKATSITQQKEVHNAVTNDQGVTMMWVFPFAYFPYAPVSIYIILCGSNLKQVTHAAIRGR